MPPINYTILNDFNTCKVYTVAVVCLSNFRKPHKTKTPIKPFENVLFFFLKTEEKNGTQ